MTDTIDFYYDEGYTSPRLHHDWSTRLGVNAGKVFLRRRGQVPRNSQGRVIAFNPENVMRGDIILDHNLQPLRNRRLRYGR